MTNQTPGAILRQKREEKKLTLDQVFNAIKIRTNYLQAIENDQLDQLPSKVQARGFIRLYASYLGIDPYSLLESVEPEEVEPTPTIEEQPVEEEKRNKKQPVPATTEEEETVTLQEMVGILVKRGSERVKSGFEERTQAIKGSLQRLRDRIPFAIVRKGQTPPTVETVAVRQPEPPKKAKPVTRSQNTYLAMSKAIGEDLRKAREALGLSLADVERQIRIREIYLFSIEEGNLDQLPSTVQGRGMLGSYAAFLNLDSEVFLSRFAEVLQQKRLETLSESKNSIPIPASDAKKSITGIKKLVSPDMVFTGGLFLVFFVFIVWGAFQIMAIGGSSIDATAIPISDVLLASGTPTLGEMVVVETSLPTQMNTEPLITFETTQESTQIVSLNDPIQLTVVANKRAFMQVTVDGKTVFLGRTIPGNAYSYSGKTRISLLSGDASALQVYYNSNYLGILGIVGQVVNMDFTSTEAIDNTTSYTPTPTVTVIASLTPVPSATPTETPPAPAPTSAYQVPE